MKTLRIAAIALCITLIYSQASAWQIWRTGEDVPAWRPTAGGLKPSPGDPPAPLEINHDLQSAPAGTDVLLNEAMEIWSSVEGAAIGFQNAGSTSCNGGISCKNDGYNSVIWISDSNHWHWTEYALAITYWVSPNFDSYTGEVTETDVQINGVNFNWSLEGFPTTAEIDLLSVLVHELGHVCMLHDLYDETYSHSTMFGIIRPGTVRAATLHRDDIDGLRFLYPETASDIPAPQVTGFKVSGDSQFRDKVIGSQGSVMNGIQVEGHGFIETDGVNNIEVDVYQNDAPVADPAAGVTSFADYSQFGMKLDLTGSVGGYDLMVINPDNKAGMAYGAIQVNDPANTAPNVSVDSSSATALRKKTVCAQGRDSDGDQITYSWELKVKPESSSAVLDSTSGECTSFTPDLPGYYLLEVTPSDGLVSGYTAASLVTVNRFPTVGGEEGLSGGCAVGNYREAEIPGADIILVLLVPFLAVVWRRLYRPGR